MTYFVTALAGLFSLIVLTRPRTAFYILVFLLPFTPRYLSLGVGEASLALSFKRIMIIFLFGALAVILPIKPHFRERILKKITRHRTILSIVAIFFVIKLGSTLVNGKSTDVMYFFDEAVMAFVVLLYGMMFVNDYDDITRIAAVIVSGLIITEVFAAVELGLGRPLLQGIVSPEIMFASKNPLLGHARGGSYRTMAFFDNPLILAEYVCISVPFVLCLQQSHRKYWNVAMLLAPFTVLTTGARSGLIVIIAGVILLFAMRLYLRSGRMFRVPLILLGIFIVAVVAWQTVSLIEEPRKAISLLSIVNANPEGTRSILERADQYSAVIMAIRDSPYIGIGMRQNLSTSIDVLNKLDNYYLRILLEAGIVGLSVYIVLLFFIVSKLLSQGVESREIYNRRLISALILSAAIFSLYKLFLSVPYNNVYLFLIVVCLMTIVDRQRTGYAQSAGPYGSEMSAPANNRFRL